MFMGKRKAQAVLSNVVTSNTARPVTLRILSGLIYSILFIQNGQSRQLALHMGFSGTGYACDLFFSCLKFVSLI